MEGIRPSYGYGRLRLWERATGQEILTLGQAITKALAFSPSGRLLAAGAAGQPGHLNVGYGSGIDIWRPHRQQMRKCDTTVATSILAMQQHRAVELLEWLGTPAARNLLRTSAGGAPRARLIVEAQVALKRLQD